MIPIEGVHVSRTPYTRGRVHSNGCYAAIFEVNVNVMYVRMHGAKIAAYLMNLNCAMNQKWFLLGTHTLFQNNFGVIVQTVSRW